MFLRNTKALIVTEKKSSSCARYFKTNDRSMLTFMVLIHSSEFSQVPSSNMNYSAV